MKNTHCITPSMPAAAPLHGQKADLASNLPLPPHVRRCVPVLGLPYVPAGQTTGEHLRQVFATERKRLALLASVIPTTEVTTN